MSSHQSAYGFNAIVWENTDTEDIMFIPSASNGSFDPTINLTSDHADITNNTSPTLAYNWYDVAVAWQGIKNGKSKIFSTVNLGTITEIDHINYEAETPKIGGDPYDGNTFKLLWKVKDRDLVASLNFVNGSWDSFDQIKTYDGNSISSPEVSETGGILGSSKYGTASYIVDVDLIPTQIAPSIINNNTVLNAGNSYLIEETITVSNNANLTIEAGSTLLFESGKRLIIEAGSSLKVKGTEKKPVTFKASGSSKWYGIKFEENASATSSIEYAQIENASNGIYIYKSNPAIKNNTIKNITYKAVYLYRSSSLVQNNLIEDSKYGVYVSQSNYISETPNITDNTINNCTYGIRLYASSPNILRNDILGDNGPSSTSYGIYCSSSSAPNLGYMGDPGNNYIHGTNKGLNASSSSPFLGEEYCADNGGYNRFENNDLHIYAYGTSTVLAENNWWGSPSPSSSLFSTGSPATIDYMPWLTSSPSFNTQINGSPETVSFDNSLGKLAISSGDTALTEAEAMANFDENWPLLRQLKFANNLVQLSFPESAYNICKKIISSAPDSNLAYLAFDILWKAGRADDESFAKFRNYTDSLSQLEYQEEIEEHAQFVDEEYDDEGNLGKRSGKNALGYLGYKHPRIAANFLFRDLESSFVANDNREAAMDIFKIMVTEFPDEAATFEAKMLLDIDEDIDIEKEFNIPLEYKLSQNYPNPFNLETTFEFGLPKTSDIKIEIFNAIGQKVHTISQKNLLPGKHKIIWNGANEFGTVVATGLYFYKFKAVSLLNKSVSFEKVNKMILLK